MNQVKLNSLSINKREKEIYLFSDLINKYNDSSKIAYIVDSSGNLKILKKKDIISHVNYLSNLISKNFTLPDTRQLKIFSVIKASHESFIIKLTSAFLGGHHCICFEELSETAIALRIKLFEPDLIICRNDLLKKINSSIKLTGKKYPCIGISSKNFEQSKQSTINKEQVKFKNKEKPYTLKSKLFTLFTSGSTGTPKGIVHNASKYIDFAVFTCSYFFGLNKTSIMFTATDAGWINGHTYAVYGPMCLGSSIVIHENLQVLSSPKELLNLFNKIKLTCFYASVTLLRLIKSKTKNPLYKSSKINSESLNRIGSCGEPLANEVGKWAIKFFQPKRKTIVNTYFQTETGGILVAPREEDGIPSDYSSVGKPRKELGLVFANEIFNTKQLLKNDLKPNEILIQNKWDGLFEEVLSDRKTDYWIEKNIFRLHDIGYMDKQGFLYIGGRSDDVINTAGHRISSSEIESVCLKLPIINEVCAIAKKHYLLGEVPVLFVSSDSNDHKSLSKIIIDLINENLSEAHQPEQIYIFQNLPKTRSGKIMRRMMRDLVNNFAINKYSDYSTLANKNEFIQSEKKFFCQVVDEYTSYVNEFNLKAFINDSGVSSYAFILNLMIIRIIEGILALNKELEIINLEIKLINRFKDIFHEVFHINQDMSLLDLDNKLKNSSLRKESCMKDINKLLIKVEFKDQKEIKYLINKTPSEDINFYITEIKKDSDFKTNFDFLQNSMNLTQEINLQSYATNSKENESIKNIIDKQKSKNIFKCFKCGVSCEEIANERGIELSQVYLIKILNHEGKTSLICDTCMQGW